MKNGRKIKRSMWVAMAACAMIFLCIGGCLVYGLHAAEDYIDANCRRDLGALMEQLERPYITRLNTSAFLARAMERYLFSEGERTVDLQGEARFLSALDGQSVLDILFVTAFQMGVAGVALATVLSQCVSAALTVLCLTGSDGMCHLDIRRLRFYPERFAQIMKIGLPAGMQSVIFNISNVLIQSSINSFGAVAVAGNTAAANVEGFVYISMNSLYQTTLSFTSQNLGAKQYRRVDGILVRCMILVILIGVVLGQGAYRLGDPLLHIYSQDPEVIAYGIQRFSVVSVTYFLCGMMDVGSGVVRGLGYSIMPMLVSMVGACVFRVIWIFTVFRMYHTLFTLYVSYPISWVLTVIAHMICYLIVRRRMFPEKAA